MSEDIKNTSVKSTMEIILHAGDARVLIMQAMDCLGDFKYDKADKLLKEAHEKLVLAHKLQTERLQEEAEGKNVEYSVLFTHAQDTLMKINTEYNIVKHLIAVFKARDKREGRI